MKQVGESHCDMGTGPGRGVSGACPRRRGAVRRARGFTILELLIVAAILAVVAMILAPTALGIAETARVMNCGLRMHSLAMAHAMYARANQDQKPDFRRAPGCWASPDTKAYCRPVGQGLLVQSKYVPFEELLCPGWGMRADNAKDCDMWQNNTYSGSSYLYRWWNDPDPASVPRGDVRTTYTGQLSSGLLALASDINLEGDPKSFQGVFANRYTAHESVGLLNVLQVDGTVREYNFNATLVRYPGDQRQVLDFFNSLSVDRTIGDPAAAVAVSPQ